VARPPASEGRPDGRSDAANRGAETKRSPEATDKAAPLEGAEGPTAFFPGPASDATEGTDGWTAGGTEARGNAPEGTDAGRTDAGGTDALGVAGALGVPLAEDGAAPAVAAYSIV
jgi:hypothetical protein